MRREGESTKTVNTLKQHQLSYENRIYSEKLTLIPSARDRPSLRAEREKRESL
jgi:hypothetical protein